MKTLHHIVRNLSPEAHMHWYSTRINAPCQYLTYTSRINIAHEQQIFLRAAPKFSVHTCTPLFIVYFQCHTL